MQSSGPHFCLHLGSGIRLLMPDCKTNLLPANNKVSPAWACFRLCLREWHECVMKDREGGREGGVDEWSVWAVKVCSWSQCDTGPDLSWALDQSGCGKTTKPIRDQTRVLRVTPLTQTHTHPHTHFSSLQPVTVSQSISGALNPFSTEPHEDMHGCTHVNHTHTSVYSSCLHLQKKKEVGAEV